MRHDRTILTLTGAAILAAGTGPSAPDGLRAQGIPSITPVERIATTKRSTWRLAR